MAVPEVFNQEARDLDGFSGRLNALVDLTGKYGSLPEGRVAQLAQKFDVSRTTMHFWLNTNKMPKRSQLSALVEGLLIDIKEPAVSLESVKAWLEYGSAVPNPFLGAETATSQEINAVYRTLFAKAKAMGITDMDSLLSESDSDHIIRTALEVMLKTSPPRSPDPDLIGRLLEKAIQKKGR